MKIALTVIHNDKPSLVMDFDDYYELRDYWKRRGRKWIKNYRIERADHATIAQLRAAVHAPADHIPDGFRLLSAEETIEDGDEWFSSVAGAWMPTRCVGGKPVPSTVYRRPYAGEGYVLLPPGSPVQPGDEYLVVKEDDSTEWVTSVCNNMKAPNPTEVVGGRILFKHRYYRRRVAPNIPEPPEGWVRMKAEDTVTAADRYWYPVKKDWVMPPICGQLVDKAVGYYIRKLDSTASES